MSRHHLTLKQMILALLIGFALMWASSYARAADLAIPKLRPPPALDPSIQYDNQLRPVKPHAQATPYICALASCRLGDTVVPVGTVIFRAASAPKHKGYYVFIR